MDGETVEVTITPTYSGCPAMNMIAVEIEVALDRAGIHDSRVRTVLSPAWTTDWLTEAGRQKLTEYGIAPPVAGSGRRALFGVETVAVPSLRIGGYEATRGIRVDVVQGAMAVPVVPRAVRLLQMPLMATAPRFHSAPHCRSSPRNRRCGVSRVRRSGRSGQATTPSRRANT